MNILIIGRSKGLGEQLKDSMETPFAPMEFANNIVCLSRSSNIPLDLEWNADYISELVRKVVQDRLGGALDILVISSGMGAYYAPTVSGVAVEKMFKVNVLGPLAVFRGCQKFLLTSKGKACFITSTCSRRPGAGGLSIYGATKGAINSWVISEARRQAKKGIALFAVSPGFFDSEMTDEIKPELRTAITKAIPFRRFGEINEVAEFVESLLFQSNWCLSGQIFECSGGA